jgi:hypothetical protein
MILKKFSKKFFREHFFQAYLLYAKDPVANIRLRFVSMLVNVRQCLRNQLDAIFIQKLVEAIEPINRDSSSDILHILNEIILKNGPLDSRFISQFPETDYSDDFAMISPQSANKPLARISSVISITDKYLLFDNVQMITVPEKFDKLREEEESKLSFDVPGDNWNPKKQSDNKKVPGKDRYAVTVKKSTELAKGAVVKSKAKFQSVQPSPPVPSQRSSTPVATTASGSKVQVKGRSSTVTSKDMPLDKLSIIDDNSYDYETSGLSKITAKPVALLRKMSPRTRIS